MITGSKAAPDTTKFWIDARDRSLQCIIIFEHMHTLGARSHFIAHLDPVNDPAARECLEAVFELAHAPDRPDRRNLILEAELPDGAMIWFERTRV